MRTARAIMGADPAQLGEACGEVRAALADAGPMVGLSGLAGVLPFERAHAWSQVPPLADAASHACNASDQANLLLADMSSAAGQSAGGALLGSLRQHPREIGAIGLELNAVADALRRIDAPALAGEERLRSLTPLVDAAQAREADLRAVAALAPSSVELLARLLGGDQPRTYLLLGQNNEEVRATGGFIGTLGRLTVADGAIVASDVRSSYLWDSPDIAPLPAPEPLQRYMNFGAWFLRDANWWIDYRRSVAQVMLMWDRDQGGSADISGVIAVDRQALDGLLEAVHGVDVPELGGVVTPANVGTLLDDRRRQGAQGSFADYHRVKTEALSGVYRALLKKIVAARGTDLIRVAVGLGRAAEAKHVLLWFRDADLQDVAAGRGWDGRLDPGSGDFFGVVDSSLSYGKVAPYIDKQVDYQREPDGTTLVQLTYTNRFQPTPGADWDPIVDGTWWDWRAEVFLKEQGAWLGYVRVVAPEGSRLLSADGWDDTPSTTAEGAAAIFGGPVLVRPGQTRTVALSYANPAPTSSPPRLFQQPGAPPPQLDGRSRLNGR